MLQLGGLAREFARELSTQTLQTGQVIDLNDGQGPFQASGLEYLIYVLTGRFQELAIETNLRAMFNYQNVHRLPGEKIDEALARFELLKKRARDRSGYNMGIAGDTHLLLNGLRIPALTAGGRSPKGASLGLCT